MTTIEPAVVAQRSPRARSHSDLLRAQVADYWALTKPDVNFLILITTFAGFWLALPNTTAPLPVLRLASTLIGTLLVAAGTGTLNQYIERRHDAQMRRTARRPLASGRMQPSAALQFGILLSSAGLICLAVAVNALASLLAALTLISYLFVYTPLKRKTPLCTLVGAIPGAMPALIGWAGASGKLAPEAWALYGIVFLWQFPHFMAIAWMYREDYARAGYLVLPFGDSRHRFMAWQTLVPTLALVAVSLIPALLGGTGGIHLAGALFLSSTFLYCAARFVLRRSNALAKQLLFASIIYLPLLFALTAFGKR
jgi:protoheme IX farnesyltransferase